MCGAEVTGIGCEGAGAVADLRAAGGVDDLGRAEAGVEGDLKMGCDRREAGSCCGGPEALDWWTGLKATCEASEAACARSKAESIVAGLGEAKRP